MNFAISLLAALLLAISAQSRGTPGTDPNKPFTCASDPSRPTGICIAKASQNEYYVHRADLETVYSCANQSIKNKPVTGTLCCFENYGGVNQPQPTSANALLTSCIAPDP
ncbi:uncharacterized protein PGTG_19797 [Puccinia graminis f. sp. tritici CRL 75-36-700-3]|uniref:Hydrophobin n=2 Tax=Puccinia graminis f. sp. tritici TaxID=56615 RepID=E3LB45_PUCGT|nr:uncharacterized protein PGTG_19797 [Puccinia graminis f. sp. tritici CRL 75-36-700-3]EFP93770.1 hypothetical protein PGTG_19797 [Puccinia graminis f. sp. tritici CRL 75-36-700-3]